MTGEVGEILKQTKPPRVLMAEKYVEFQFVRLLQFCDLHEVCFEEVLEIAEEKFLQAVDPPENWNTEAKDGLPTVQE